MPVAILMPALSPTMTEGNIAKWLKTIGDDIVSGDIIAEVETDKATMEVEAIDEGKLAAIMFPDGSENVPVNKLIGVISLEGEDEKDIKSFLTENTDKTLDKNTDKVIKKQRINSSENKENLKEDSINLANTKKNLEEEITNPPEKHKKVNIENDINKMPSSQIENNKEQRILISPLAKRIAELKNIDVSKLIGSGPRGRIVKKDLEANIEVESIKVSNSFINEDIEEKSIIKLTNIRKTIASRLKEAKSTIPHFYLKGKAEVETLVKERIKLNKFLEDNNANYKLSFNDYFIKALALSLKRVPAMNATWNGDGTLTAYKQVDISVAVATDDGLFTPVIKHACTKSLEVISNEVKSFASKAKEGRLLPNEYTGGSFSISNLGMYGIEEFSAIINPPQSGIIAIGDIIKEPVVNNNDIKISNTVSYVVSVDHRIVDGATAAQLLKYFRFFLNNPSAMLI